MSLPDKKSKINIIPENTVKAQTIKCPPPKFIHHVINCLERGVTKP